MTGGGREQFHTAIQDRVARKRLTGGGEPTVRKGRETIRQPTTNPANKRESRITGHSDQYQEWTERKKERASEKDEVPPPAGREEDDEEGPRPPPSKRKVGDMP